MSDVVCLLCVSLTPHRSFFLSFSSFTLSFYHSISAPFRLSHISNQFLSFFPHMIFVFLIVIKLFFLYFFVSLSLFYLSISVHLSLSIYLSLFLSLFLYLYMYILQPSRSHYQPADHYLRRMCLSVCLESVLACINSVLIALFSNFKIKSR